MLGFSLIAQLIVPQLAVAQAAHVELDAVAGQFAGQCKLPQLLPLQHHPIAHSNLIMRRLSRQFTCQ